MTPELSTHLTEEALDDVLIGLGSAESEAHAAACPECRARLDAFRGDVTLFNQASMAWSESRAARTPLAPTRLAGARVRFGFVSWAAVAALLVVAAVATWRHAPPPAPNHANVVESTLVDSEAQIAQDNELLQAVNAAISPEEESPIVEYRLSKAVNPNLKLHPKTRTR